MIEITASAARRHWGRLFERVAQGERVLITRRGKPVAMLVLPEEQRPNDIAEVVHEMLACRDRSGPRLGKGVTIRDLRVNGRRF